MTPFTQAVIELIQAIPEGKVMTYGQIAACAGNPRGARQVVRILHAMSRKHALPWHRVINAQGELPPLEAESADLQAILLEGEGVALLPGRRVDLAVYRHHPGAAVTPQALGPDAD